MVFKGIEPRGERELPRGVPDPHPPTSDLLAITSRTRSRELALALGHPSARAAAWMVAVRIVLHRRSRWLEVVRKEPFPTRAETICRVALARPRHSPPSPLPPPLPPSSTPIAGAMARSRRPLATTASSARELVAYLAARVMSTRAGCVGVRRARIPASETPSALARAPGTWTARLHGPRNTWDCEGERSTVMARRVMTKLHRGWRHLRTIRLRREVLRDRAYAESYARMLGYEPDAILTGRPQLDSRGRTGSRLNV